MAIKQIMYPNTFCMKSLWKTVYLYTEYFFFLTNLRFIENILTSCSLCCVWMPVLDLLSTLSCTVGPKLADMNSSFFCFRADCSNEPFIGPSPKYWQTHRLFCLRYVVAFAVSLAKTQISLANMGRSLNVKVIYS